MIRVKGRWPSGQSCGPQEPWLPRERVGASGGNQLLLHPVVDVDEALEAPFRVLDDVEEGAPVELHVGEVLEQHVDRVDSRTLELLTRQHGAMHARDWAEGAPDRVRASVLRGSTGWIAVVIGRGLILFRAARLRFHVAVEEQESCIRREEPEQVEPRHGVSSVEVPKGASCANQQQCGGDEERLHDQPPGAPAVVTGEDEGPDPNLGREARENTSR